MSEQSKKPFRQEKAQTFVEFALVFPVLLMVVYGIIEFGRMLFIYTAVTSSAREGARYGSAAGDVGGMPHYADCVGILDSITQVGILAGIDTTYPGPSIQIQYDSGPSTAIKYSQCPPPPNDIHYRDRILVSVVAHYDPIIPFLNFQGFDIDAEARRTIIKDMEIEGTPPPPVPSSTPVPPTPTDTPVPPTPTDTLVPSYTPSETVGPSQTPTETSTPTNTATFTPTFTPIPPCEINSGPISFSGQTFSWVVQSVGSADSVRLIGLTVDWPVGRPSAILGQIDFGPPVWSGSVDTSPFSVCGGCWTGLESYRNLARYESKTLSFHLSRPLYGGGYSITAYFQVTDPPYEECSAAGSGQLP